MIAVVVVAACYFVSCTKKNPLFGQKITHIAIVMDGNRRWAKNLNKPAVFGHEAGARVIPSVVDFCLKHKIKYLTLYAFSLENLQREKSEIADLMSLVKSNLSNSLASYVEQKVKVRVLGDRSSLDEELLEKITEVENATSGFCDLNLSILACYGGQQEICEAVVGLVNSGSFTSKKLTYDDIKNNMWTSELPPPEVIIRTGKRNRLSNFLLFDSAYAEIFFVQKFWPDFCEKDLDVCCCEFFMAERSFGR